MSVIAEGVALSVSVLLLPEVLAGFAAATLVVIIAAGARYAFTHPAAAMAWARQVLGALSPPGGTPMPDPLPPLPPMEVGPDLPAHTGHDLPTVRLPQLPMPDAPWTLPAVSPGRDIMEPGLTIFETGKGTSSGGARRAARRVDPEVTQRLANADWRAHHLINLAAVRRGNEVIRAATRAGWLPNEMPNIAPLPHTPKAQERLQADGMHRPVHDSGHPKWNDQVLLELESTQRRLDKRFGEAESLEKDRAALQALRKLQEKLRRNMLKKDRLTMLQGQGPQQDA